MPCNFKLTNGASTSIVSTSSNTVSTSASTISTSASTVSSSGNIMSVSVDSKYSQYLCQIVSMEQLTNTLVYAPFTKVYTNSGFTFHPFFR